MTVLSRIRATILQHGLIAPGDWVVIGISGGPDALALTHLMLALREEWQLHLHLAHLNHMLRSAESDEDARFVGRVAREWDLPATIESRDVGAYAREHRLSAEQAAREVRYA